MNSNENEYLEKLEKLKYSVDNMEYTIENLESSIDAQNEYIQKVNKILLERTSCIVFFIKIAALILVILLLNILILK